MQTEIQSLQNAANLIGLTIHEKFNEDKRKTAKMYFATKNGTTVSPTLNFSWIVKPIKLAAFCSD